MIILRQKLGTLEIEVQGEDPKELIQQLSFFTTLPSECPLCHEPLVLTFKIAGVKRYQYFGMRCTGRPAHECNFGVRTDDQNLYYKGAGAFKLAFEETRGGGGGPTPDEIPEEDAYYPPVRSLPAPVQRPVPSRPNAPRWGRRS